MIQTEKHNNRGTGRILKRTVDLIISGIFLCTLFPLCWIIIGIIIKRSSPGPILFKQKRTGYQGKEFICYKFRTMVVNHEADLTQATSNDPRVTKCGLFLRKTSLDELPQFFNVFIGNMSIVGPRPHMVKHTLQYAPLIPDYMKRHEVKPGITGWAQIKGYRGETRELGQMEARVKADLWYISNQSFLLDLKIILKTVAIIFLKNEHAY